MSAQTSETALERRRARPWDRFKRTLATAETAPAPLAPVPPRDRTWLFPGSDELFREIYTRCGITGPQTVAVTSAIAGEGKTTIALGLAASIAQDFPQRRIVLVEVDLRRPTLARDFGFEPVPGLSDCLTTGRSMQDALRPTDLENLFVVPSGSATSAASRILRSGALVDAIGELRQMFDLLILDLPALLVSSDTSLLTDLADGTVLVVRAGVTPTKSVERAVKQIEESKLRGAILNGAESSLPGWLRRLGGI